MAAAEGDRPGQLRVQVLGGFSLAVDDVALRLPHHAERVLAYLALCSRPQPRAVVAAALWADADSSRAAGNLRNAVWRVRSVAPDLLRLAGRHLQLSPEARLDLDAAVAQARALLGTGPVPLPRDPRQRVDDTRAGHIDLDAELLPLWDEEWVPPERERLRQLRLHALEALCRRLSLEGRHAGAVEAGRSAVALEPLRESGREALVRAHLAEGNLVEAVREVAGYRRLLADELGVAPSPGLLRLVLTDPGPERRESRPGLPQHGRPGRAAALGPQRGPQR